MTFGIARGVAQDAAGNVQTNVWIEVRRMAPGFPLAVPIYADADGATGLDNPFFSASGEFAFYAVGGLYRVRVYRTGFDKTWDNVPVGTAQAADVNAYARAGFTWAPESATSTPPTAGCIRLDNADVSLASHVYLDKDTLGGSDATAWLTSMAPGDWLLLATGVGIETGWKVVAVTNHTDWFDVEVDDSTYSGPAGPLSFGDAGFVSVSQQGNGSIDAGTGLLVQTGTNTYVARTITGTANELSVANGSGVGGNPTLSLPTALTFTGKTITGGTFASPTGITGLPDPTNAQDAATKAYVDNLAAGLDIKASARAATTGNITLSGTQTIDGVSVVAGNRVLVKAQTTPSQNGIYVVAAGAWSRATDMDAWSEVPGATLWVEEGSTLADTAWVCTANAGGTIGSTAITWTQFGGTGAFQGLNANLTAIAGLTTAADKLTYWTGSGTAALTDLSSFARTLLDDASASTARTTLGVAIGSDVQAYNSQLANIAAVTPAQGDILYYNGTAWVKLAAGTNGNFLKTQGTGANPTWASVPGGGDMLAANNLSDVVSASSARTNIGAVGKTNIVIFTASGTYTPPAGLLCAQFETLGGGGGGGGVSATGTGTNTNAAGGGGAGGYSRVMKTAAAIDASQTITVGTGGNGGAAGNNNGSSGGDTSVGTLCVAKGGSGGTGAANQGASAGGAGGVAGTGDIAAPGASGAPGVMGTSAITVAGLGGGGGANPMFGAGGAGGRSGGSAAAGANAGGYGAGGGGASSQNTNSTAAGGNGAAGLVVITEFLSG